MSNGCSIFTCVADELAAEVSRRCTLCGVLKPLAEFHRRGTGYQTWCKVCRKGYDARYHAGRRTLRIAQKRERVGYLVAWMRDLKSQPCADCGGRFHPAAMTFDHLPGTTKRAHIADLIRHGSIGLARAEIAKCEIVCANCHAVRTYLRRAQARAVSEAQAGPAIAKPVTPFVYLSVITANQVA